MPHAIGTIAAFPRKNRRKHWKAIALKLQAYCDANVMETRKGLNRKVQAQRDRIIGQEKEIQRLTAENTKLVSLLEDTKQSLAKMLEEESKSEASSES